MRGQGFARLLLQLSLEENCVDENEYELIRQRIDNAKNESIVKRICEILVGSAYFGSKVNDSMMVTNDLKDSTMFNLENL